MNINSRIKNYCLFLYIIILNTGRKRFSSTERFWVENFLHVVVAALMVIPEVCVGAVCDEVSLRCRRGHVTMYSNYLITVF